MWWDTGTQWAVGKIEITEGSHSWLGCDDFIRNVIKLKHDYTVTQQWSNGLKFDIHKKDKYIKNGAGKKIVGHSKLKLWAFSEVMVNVNDIIYNIIPYRYMYRIYM